MFARGRSQTALTNPIPTSCGIRRGRVSRPESAPLGRGFFSAAKLPLTLETDRSGDLSLQGIEPRKRRFASFEGVAVPSRSPSLFLFATPRLFLRLTQQPNKKATLSGGLLFGCGTRNVNLGFAPHVARSPTLRRRKTCEKATPFRGSSPSHSSTEKKTDTLLGVRSLFGCGTRNRT